MNDKDGRGNYDVGYGKPPRHTQFKRGANPNRGSPKSEPINIAEILDDKVTAIRNGKPVRIHGHEAKMIALGKKALARTLGVVDAFLKECEKAGLLEPPPGPQMSGVIEVPAGVNMSVVKRLIDITGHGPPWEQEIYDAVVEDFARDTARLDELYKKLGRSTNEQ